MIKKEKCIVYAIQYEMKIVLIEIYNHPKKMHKLKLNITQEQTKKKSKIKDLKKSNKFYIFAVVTYIAAAPPPLEC